MLRSHSTYIAPSRAKGFSLIEMMISITIGMIVAAGAVMLIVAIDRANSETIQSTRVNQELRALSSVIIDEIKRARRLHDPVAAVGQGAPTIFAAFDKVDTSQGSCVVYGYQDTPLIAPNGDVNEEFVNYYEAIYLESSSVKFARLKKTKADMVGVVDPTSFSRGCTDAANAGSTTVVPLTSPQLKVTGLTFSCKIFNGANVVTDATKPASCNQIDMSITATLLSGDTTTKNIPHTYVQQVFIRSGAVKTG